MSNNLAKGLSSALGQRRLSLSLTLAELAAKSGVSESHLARIEQGGRFPSARILQKIAKPLGFDEGELLMSAGYLSRRSSGTDADSPPHGKRALDPYVAGVLAQEPVGVQRVVLVILSILRGLIKGAEGE